MFWMFFYWMVASKKKLLKLSQFLFKNNNFTLSVSTVIHYFDQKKGIFFKKGVWKTEKFEIQKVLSEKRKDFVSRTFLISTGVKQKKGMAFCRPQGQHGVTGKGRLHNKSREHHHLSGFYDLMSSKSLSVAHY